LSLPTTRSYSLIERCLALGHDAPPSPRCVVASPGPPSPALAGRAFMCLGIVSQRLGVSSFFLQITVFTPPGAPARRGFLSLLCIGGSRTRRQVRRWSSWPRRGKSRPVAESRQLGALPMESLKPLQNISRGNGFPKDQYYERGN
jgi:hypothetical protein